MKAEPTWDVMITAIPHRHAKLCELLAEFGRQAEPGFGVRVFYDNLETPYGDKTQALSESSRADYISSVDDDDWVAPDFVSRVRTAIWDYRESYGELPDYVGFPVRWTRGGEPMAWVEHSLRHGAWSDDAALLKRDIAQFNPMRREIALTGRWAGGYEAERVWGNEVRAAGRCRTEAWIPDPMYYYREDPGDTFKTGRVPFPLPLPPLPEYPWLTVL